MIDEHEKEKSVINSRLNCRFHHEQSSNMEEYQQLTHKEVHQDSSSLMYDYDQFYFITIFYFNNI